MKMKFLKIMIIVIVALLSLAAGLAKLFQAPQEVAFFELLGLNTTVLVVAGLLQVLSAVLLIPPKSRNWGAALAAISFLVSTFMIFLNGQLGFGIFSLVPVLLAVWVFINSKSKVRLTD